MDERTTLRYIDELQGQIDQLKKIIKGGGGGGGSVVINPEGSATADFEKIKSGNTIYGLNYNKNANRPQINGNLLTGNKNSKQLNIAESMTEAEYAALSSKNENEIYFLQEKASIVTETEDGYTITWEASSDPAYVATLSYAPSDQDVTGITSVTCDTDTIEILTFVLDHGDVSVIIGCEDPSEVPDDVEFTFTFTQPVGSTRIMKNGIEIARSYSETSLYDNSGTTNENTVHLSESLFDFDQVILKVNRSADNVYQPIFITLLPSRLSINDNIPALVWASGTGTYFTYTLTNATTLTLFNQGTNCFLKEVIGIKF